MCALTKEVFRGRKYEGKFSERGSAICLCYFLCPTCDSVLWLRICRSGGRQRQGTLVPMNMDRCRSEHAHAGGRERILCLTHAFSDLQYKKIRPIFCNLLKSIFSISLFLTFSPKFNIGHNFTVDWIPLPKRLKDNSVEMYISKHYTSPLWISIFLLRLYFRKSPVSTGGQLSRAL